MEERRIKPKILLPAGKQEQAKGSKLLTKQRETTVKRNRVGPRKNQPCKRVSERKKSKVYGSFHAFFLFR